MQHRGYHAEIFRHGRRTSLIRGAFQPFADP